MLRCQFNWEWFIPVCLLQGVHSNISGLTSRVEHYKAFNAFAKTL